MGGSYHRKKPSPLHTIAIICSMLDQGISEDEIRKTLDPDGEFAPDFLTFYIDFAIENNWLTKEEGKYSITPSGTTFVNAFLSSNTP
ncbi:MAG TPA: hypothetical protein VF884_06880 [Nitrososphaeraceae archaeon]